MPCEVKHFLTEPQVHDLVRMFQNEWWTKGRELSQVQEMLRHSDLIVAVCDGVFSLVPGATHVTVVLREEDEGTPSYVPIVTRVRGQQGPTTQPIPITRSVFRKVVSERAAPWSSTTILGPVPIAQPEPMRSSRTRPFSRMPTPGVPQGRRTLHSCMSGSSD